MAYKQNSPYKFLGKMFGGGKGGKIGGAIGGIVAGPLGALMGNRIGRTGSLTGGGDPASGAAMGTADVMKTGVGGTKIPFSPLVKKQGYSPYTKPESKSPFKTDAILVKGAGRAASANDTAKYAIIAKSRAFSDMVDSVEKTVNRSAAAQLKKDTDRAKKTVRASTKYGNWKERYEAREDLRSQRRADRRDASNRRRAALGMRTKNWNEYGEYDPTADHGGTNTQGLYPYNYD